MATIDATKNANLEAWKRSALQQAVDAATTAASQLADYPPALTPVTVAQFLLESDWGRRGMGEANNFFGIKARTGEPSVTLETTEFVNGKPVKVPQQQGQQGWEGGQEEESVAQWQQQARQDSLAVQEPLQEPG